MKKSFYSQNTSLNNEKYNKSIHKSIMCITKILMFIYIYIYIYIYGGVIITQ